MENTTALNIQDLSFDYGGDPVLDHVSFSIQQGDYVALIGPNGVGKTTLLKILLGILSPREGAVLLHNEPVQSYRSIERAKQIAYVSQHPALSFPLTVFELVSLGRYPHSNRFERGETDPPPALIEAGGRRIFVRYGNRNEKPEQGRVESPKRKKHSLL